jgi:NlpC/P60 family protein
MGAVAGRQRKHLTQTRTPPNTPTEPNANQISSAAPDCASTGLSRNRRKFPSSQMRRGDLIFYGPNASQHEAMYLGNGMMLEAPYTGSQVKVSPVRTSGMIPYVTPLIEY